jgi:hypothetical protein
MNCTRCNTPLLPGARFCPNCGLVVTTGASQSPDANIAQTNQSAEEDPTIPISPLQAQQPTQPSPLQPPYTSQPPMPPRAYQPTVAVSPGSIPSTGYQPPWPALPARRRKHRLARALLILVAVLLVLVASWFIALRPYLHGLVQTQLDGVLSNSISQINPATTATIPPGPRTIPLTETDANSVIVPNTTASDPVQQMHITITPAGLRLDFRAYGFANTITGVPQAINGELVMTNVTVQGIASLLMSPDELTATLNAHLHDASTRLHRFISGVLLKDHEMDIQLR